MNAIIGFSELAQREYGKPAALEYIRGIRSAGASLLAIINDILDYSRIESGGPKLVPARYRPAALLNGVVALIRSRMGDRPVALETEVSPDIPSALSGDSGRVRQVLLNLLSNAVKFTERGSIRLSARSERAGPDEAALCFEVEDTGPGIRPEDMGRLFKEFTRLDEKRNSGVEGTGLGMAIARSLCRAMGGDVEAESVYGEGSLFRARVIQKVLDWSPMGPLDGGGEEAPEAEGPSFTAPGAEILVVDDLTSNLMVAEGLLEPYGARLTFASGGREAVALALSRPFDVVLMDHMMPETDGIEACRAIRESEGGAGIPIVALTANAVAGMREMFLANGFDDFLSKPIDPAGLDRLLARWIPEGKRREPSAQAQAPPAAVPPGPEGGGGAPPLPDLEGVDVRAAAARAGGLAGYLRLLAAFRQDLAGRAGTLDSVPDAGGAEGFAAAAHAVKGALAGIGAGPLSERAGALESAARGGDLEAVAGELPDFASRLESLVRAVGDALGRGTGAAPLSQEGASPEAPPGGGGGAAAPAGGFPKAARSQLEILASALRKALETHDFPRVDEELGRLRDAAAGTGMEAAVEAVADDILTADYGRAVEALADMEDGSGI
jgi:CheY-like chemotaxis protein/anti-sigma regulatory factor (Ser/Thr protein kinase)